MNGSHTSISIESEVFLWTRPHQVHVRLLMSDLVLPVTDNPSRVADRMDRSTKLPPFEPKACVLREASGDGWNEKG